MNKSNKAAQMPPSFTLRLSRGRSVKITWRPRQRVSSLLVKLLTKALAVFLPLSMGYAQAADVNALPTGGQVTAGSATINQTGNTLNINQASQKAALNWQTFNIGTNGTVNFVQPNSNAVALNRIGGNSASEIYGHLNANGQVFLMNPNGILFGRGSQVNVGGIVATTMQLGDADFLAGNYNFNNAGAGSVANYGLINATNSVALLGSDVSNQGSIFATTASLVSGNTVALDVSTDGLIRARVVDVAMQANIANSGDINATQVTLSAGQAKDTLNRVVNNSGVIKATGFSSLNGEIVLQGGTTLNSGTLDATSTTGNGGTVHMLGRHVGLIDSGSIDVSGATGGGTILVGGDYQGKNASIENAEVTYVSTQITLKADATQNGNGGKVIVWADDTTRAYGSISAKGGVLGGNGGFVETSGHRYLDVNGVRVDTLAPQGLTGSWLLDPDDIIISHIIPTTNNIDTTTAGGIYTASPNNSSSYILDSEIVSQLVNNNVIIQTLGVTYGNGNITANGVNIASSSGHNLTLAAYSDNTSNTGNISITNSTINVNGNLTLLAGWNGGLTYSGTDIRPGRGDITMSNSTIQNVSSLNLWGGRDINLDTDILLGNSGALSLQAGRKINQTVGTRLLVGSLSVVSVGDVTLNQQNSTISLSADISGSGSFSYMQADPQFFGSGLLSIGHINTTTGNISLTNPSYSISAGAGSISSSSGGNITLNSAGLTLGSTAQISTSGRVNITGGNYFCSLCGGITGGQSITLKVNGLTGSSLWGNLTSLGDIQLTTATADTDIAVGANTDINSRGLTYIYIPADMRFASTPTKLIIGDSANVGTVVVYASPTFLPTNGGNLKLQGGTVAINAPLSMGTRQLEIESKSVITQTAAITTTGTLTANAATGINLSNTGNNVGTFTAFNNSTGGIDFYNNGSVILGGITNNASSAYINIGSSGAISQTAAITTTGSLTTNAVTGINLSNTSNSVHSFAAQNTNTNNITFNNVGDIHFGAIANGASLGDITLGSSGSIYQDNNITANNGDIQLTASNNVYLDLLTVNGLIDAGVGTVGVSAGLNITDGNGAGNNIKASYVGLTAGDASAGPGSIDVDTQVQQLLVENLDANSTSSVKIRNTGSPLLVNAYSSDYTNTLEITNNNSIHIGHIGGAVDTTITATGTTSDIQLGSIGCSCSTILSDGKVVLSAGHDVLIYDDHVSAGTGMDVTAGRDVIVTANANNASLYTASGNQNITAGRNITLTGGNSSTGAYAEIEHGTGAGNQTINLINGGTLSLTGGLGISGNYARIENSSTDSASIQKIWRSSSGSAPAILMNGGSTGGSYSTSSSIDLSNSAEIGSDFGQQVIYASTIDMAGMGGATGYAGAIISAPNQQITTTGNVTLLGGSSNGVTAGTGDQFTYTLGTTTTTYNLASPAAIGDKNTLIQTLDIGGTLTLNGGSSTSGVAMVGSLHGVATGSIKANAVALNSSVSLAFLGGVEDIIVTNTFANVGGAITDNSLGSHPWSIWALNPTKITGCGAGTGCLADFAQYGVTFGSTPAPTILGTGHGWLYSAAAPALTATTSTNYSRVYDGTANAYLTASNFTVAGANAGDTVALASITGNFANKNVGTAKAISRSAATFSVTAAGIPVYGYATPTISGLTADITQATLNWSVANATGNTGTTPVPGLATLSVIFGSDAVNGVVSAYDANNALAILSTATPEGVYTEKVTGLTGTDAGNYSLASTGTTGVLTVGKSVITPEVEQEVTAVTSETISQPEDTQTKQDKDEAAAPEKVLVALNFVDDPKANKDNPIETEKPKGRTLQCSVNK